MRILTRPKLYPLPSWEPITPHKSLSTFSTHLWLNYQFCGGSDGNHVLTRFMHYITQNVSWTFVIHSVKHVEYAIIIRGQQLNRELGLLPIIRYWVDQMMMMMYNLSGVYLQCPIIIPIIVLLASIYLIVAPILDAPDILYLYVTIFILAGAVLYFPLVAFKLHITPFGKWH